MPLLSPGTALGHDWQARFWKLAAANVISNLSVPLAALANTAFLGHLANLDNLAGVSLAGVLFNYLFKTFACLRMSTTGLTAQATGRGDAAEGQRVLGRGLAIALACALGLLLLRDPLRDLGFRMLQAPADTRAAAIAYYNVLIWAAPAVLLNYVLLGWFLGTGRARPVLLLSLLGNSLNGLGDAWLIGHLGWGSRGAAVATLLSQSTVLLLGLRLAWTAGARPCWPLGPLGTWQGFARLNRDLFLRTLAVLTVLGLFTAASARLGTDLLVANSLLLQIVLLASYFIDGLAYATETLSGQLLGQQERSAQAELLRLGLGLSLTIGLAIATLFCLWPEPLIALLTPQPVVLATARPLLPWLWPVLGLGAIAFLLDGYFLGQSRGRLLRNTMLLAAAIFLGVALLALQLRSGPLLWLGLSLFMGLRATVLSWAIRADQRSCR